MVKYVSIRPARSLFWGDLVTRNHVVEVLGPESLLLAPRDNESAGETQVTKGVESFDLTESQGCRFVPEKHVRKQ